MSNNILIKVNSLLEEASRSINTLIKKRRLKIAEDMKLRRIDIEKFKNERNEIVKNIKVNLEEKGIGPKNDPKKMKKNELLCYLNSLNTDSEKVLFYEYVYWSMCPEALKPVFKKENWYRKSNRFPFHYKCPICKKSGTYFMPRHLHILKQPCKFCNHITKEIFINDSEYCDCNFCKSIDEKITEHIISFRTKLFDLINNNIDFIRDRFFEKYAVTSKPQKISMMTDFENNKFSLSSDERHFVQFVEKIAKIDSFKKPIDIFKSLEFHKSKEMVLNALVEHKVFYELKTYPSLDIDMIIKHIEKNILLSYTSKKSISHGHGFRFGDEELRNISVTEFSFFQVGNILPNSEYSDVECHHEYIFNPFFLPPNDQNSFCDDVFHEDNRSPKMSKLLFKSPHEQECFRQLRSIFKRMIILPNYPIKLFIDLSKLKNEFNNSEFSYLLNAYVDFAIFSQEGKLLRVYEAQISKFHNKKNYIERDNLKKRLFSQCEIEFVEIHGKYHASFVQ